MQLQIVDMVIGPALQSRGLSIFGETRRNFAKRAAVGHLPCDRKSWNETNWLALGNIPLVHMELVMSDAWDREIYREKAAEMRLQAERAESSGLQAMYEMIAEQWTLKADNLDVDMPPPTVDAAQSAKL